MFSFFFITFYITFILQENKLYNLKNKIQKIKQYIKIVQPDCHTRKKLLPVKSVQHYLSM